MAIHTDAYYASVAYPRIHHSNENNNHSLLAHCEHPLHLFHEHFFAQLCCLAAQLDRHSVCGGMVGGKALPPRAVKRNKLMAVIVLLVTLPAIWSDTDTETPATKRWDSHVICWICWRCMSTHTYTTRNEDNNHSLLVHCEHPLHSFHEHLFVQRCFLEAQLEWHPAFFKKMEMSLNAATK